jgi:GTP pyrophosphokinase
MLIKCEELSSNYTDADGLKEMLLAITKDIRVIIIKSAEMLVYARKNVKNYNDEVAIKKFKAIDAIFAPISARLGLSEIKSEFQDLSFEFHDPETFKRLEEELKNESRSSEKMLEAVVSNTKNLMQANGIECKCYGRVKHLSSIHNKIRSKNIHLKNIYDITAIRILVNSISECYLVLGIIHANFIPVDGRFKDYIAHPKPNGYKSLHSTVYYENEFLEGVFSSPSRSSCGFGCIIYGLDECFLEFINFDGVCYSKFGNFGYYCKD